MTAAPAPRSRLALAAVAAVAVAALASAPAARAQSRRYPPPAVDPDERAEHASAFWSRVADPGRARYQQSVRDALLSGAADRRRGMALLLDAAHQRPELIDAWVLYGILADQVRDFAACADGYAHAVAIDPTWALRPRPAPGATVPPAPNPYAPLVPGGGIGIALASDRSLTIALAICRGRSGDLDGAIAGLQAVIARGDTARPDGRPMPELWLRLGEAYLAAGRVDDAASALAEANAVGRGGHDADALWMLAMARDRARQTWLAEAAASEAQKYDPGARLVTGSNRPPPIAAGDREYLLGLAALTPAGDPPGDLSPEDALAYFRRYLEVAPPTSPWRARAREHLDGLAGLELASRLTITGGGFGDRAAVERIVRARMPALRACLVPIPSTLVDLRITELGAAAGARPAPPAPRSRPPGPLLRLRLSSDDSGPPISEQPGLEATTRLTFEGVPTEATEAAAACVEKAAAGIVLPRPPAGSWGTVHVPIAAP
ncbi:MAG TPA: hypothetical protein VHE35_20250 [Kofleriaceae bacterium]|nr:hypothetical protein [Kofleriaceae bacterium]